jgi:ankyrin repeat-rich membrane spanning protein
MIRFLISKGADPNAKVPNLYSTPLSWALMNGQTEAASALLDNGADPNTSGMFGEESYLHAAERLNHPEIAALLRKHGAKQ